MVIIEIAGHLGADPETRFTPNGQKVTTFRVATTIKRGQKEKTLWWRITCWGDRFDRKLQYLKKGSPVVVVGEIGIPEIYQDREGNQQISLDVTAEMINFSPFGAKNEKSQDASGSSSEEADFTHTSSSSANRMQKGSANNPQPVSSFSDDEIPF